MMPPMARQKDYIWVTVATREQELERSYSPRSETFRERSYMAKYYKGEVIGALNDTLVALGFEPIYRDAMKHRRPGVFLNMYHDDIVHGWAQIGAGVDSGLLQFQMLTE